MKSRFWIALASAIFLAASAAPASALSTGDYIVTLKSNAGLKDSRLIGKAHKDRWTKAINAVRVSLTADEVVALRANTAVAAVELNQRRSLEATQTINPNHNIDNWALDALEGGPAAMDGVYNYSTTGSGVTVAVVDTGVFPNADLGSRLVVSKNFVDGANGTGSANDCQGHGTHVASIAAGTKFGVAKEASVYNLRVLDCSGSGWDADIVDALDWLAANEPNGRTVVNMSIGGGGAYGITTAVNSLIGEGISVAVAAGNETSDACEGMIIPRNDTGRPTAGVLTVGAHDSNAYVSYFSNYGVCVDLFAPGSDVLSRTIGYDSETGEPAIDPETGTYVPVDEAWSGTSMATPVVAGAVARYLEANPSATPAQIENALVANASQGALDFSGSDYHWWDATLAGSPNLLLDFSALESPVLAASISAPSALTYGTSGPVVISSDYAAAPEVSVTGNCHVSSDELIADKGVGTCTVSAYFAAEGGFAGRTVSATTRLSLATASAANPITEPGWSSSVILPQKQTLTLAAAPRKVSGSCKVNRLVLMASGSNGECTLTYNAYTDEYYSYPGTTVKVKLGPSSQSWKTKVLKAGKTRYSNRAIQLAAIPSPITNYGSVGVWSTVTGPCTLDLSSYRLGALLTHNGTRGQTCQVTLTAPGGFKLSPLVSTWVITK